MNVIYELNYEKWHQKYLNSEGEPVLNSIFIKEIQKISQEYSNNLKIRRADGDEIIEVEDSLRFYNTTKRLGSFSFAAMVELTLERGFPTKKAIGKEYYRYSRILRYNMPDDYDVNCENWQKIKGMIYVEIEKGTIYPFYYAAIEDYMRLGTKQPQLYGTITSVYNRVVGLSGKTVQYENPGELNVRRRSVGLCSIQLEMWSEARELPLSLKEVTFK